MLPLRTSRDFKATPEEIEALRNVRATLMAHMIEGPAARRVVGYKQELMPRLCRNMFAEDSLTFSIKVVLSRQHVTELAEDFAGLGKSHLWKR
ncbi:hypothetical protein D3C87_1866460 [compost metagenome]